MRLITNLKRDTSLNVVVQKFDSVERLDVANQRDTVAP